MSYFCSTFTGLPILVANTTFNQHLFEMHNYVPPKSNYDLNTELALIGNEKEHLAFLVFTLFQNSHCCLLFAPLCRQLGSALLMCRKASAPTALHRLKCPQLKKEVIDSAYLSYWLRSTENCRLFIFSEEMCLEFSILLKIVFCNGKN